jgi:hypothetical protein
MGTNDAPSGRTRLALVAGGVLIVLALVAVPVFSRLVRGDWPGQPRSSRASRDSQSAASQETKSQLGNWSAPFQLGIIPIHSVLLNNGLVLMWQYANVDGKGGILISSYNPATGQVTALQQPPPYNQNRYWNYFCSGNSELPDGKILMTGGLVGAQGQGDNGLAATVIFDPATMGWVATPNMANGRYYPTNTQLANGNTLVFSGFNYNGSAIVRQVEQYNFTSGTFTTLPPANNLPMAQKWDTYPRMFLLPSGQIFNAGGAQPTWLYTPTNPSPWTATPPGGFLYGQRHAEGAVLLPNYGQSNNLYRVMVTGGQVNMGSTKDPPTNTIEIIDLSQPTPAWTYGPPMKFLRHDQNIVQLPDQTVLVVGGVSGPDKYNNPVYKPELYDPATNAWTVMAVQKGQRGYHSTAILLPDGTVFSAGSDSGNHFQTYGEIYSPPYLFHGARPTITSAPNTLLYGKNVTIQTPDAATITSVVLIHNDAATHADHFDQRLVPLSFTVGSGQLTVTGPPNGNYAPPGTYMLFMLNSNGVPAIGQMLSLG